MPISNDKVPSLEGAGDGGAASREQVVGVGVGGGTACCFGVCACRHGHVHPFICRSGWCEGQSPNSKLVEFICGATRV
jgi:hypothetical protein